MTSEPQVKFDLLVQSRFRNNTLWELMAGRTAAEVCRQIGAGVDQSGFGHLLNLRMSPLVRNRGSNPPRYSKIACRIADHFQVLVEDLFPVSLYSLQLPETVERSYSSAELLPLLAAKGVAALEGPDDDIVRKETRKAVEMILHDLNPREDKILRLRFGLLGEVEHTQAQVGSVMGITAGRIQQIEARALSRIRKHRAKTLQPYHDQAERAEQQRQG